MTATDEATPRGPSPTPVYVWPIVVIAIAGILMAVILAVVVFVTRQKKKLQWLVDDLDLVVQLHSDLVMKTTRIVANTPMGCYLRAGLA